MKITQRVSQLAELLARNPWQILGAALLLSLLAGWATAQLPILTSRQALLPQNTAVAKRFNTFLQNFGSASDLMIVLEGAPRNELEYFANKLATKLRLEPEIAEATAHLDRAFFLNHAYLIMPEEGLNKLLGLAGTPKMKGTLEENLNKAFRWSKNPTSHSDLDIDLSSAETSLNLTMFFFEEWQRCLTSETVPTRLDWGRFLTKNNAVGMAEGYFTSRDGKMLFLFVHPKAISEDFESLAPFIETVKQVSADLASEVTASGHIPPIVGLTGLPALEYEEYINIRKDITLVLTTAGGLIAGLILLVVRSIRWAVIIFIPMGLGVLWSLGLALITVGHLTIITATFIAILFGLGADYGIFTSSRIAEERLAGKPLVEAIGSGIGSSFIAVLSAGVASVLIFGALATVNFPGFVELGVMAAKGVLMILMSTWLVQPSLYALFPPKLRVKRAPNNPAVSIQPSRQSGVMPPSMAGIIVIFAIGCASIGVVKGLAIPFDYDLLSMLPKNSQAAYYQRRMVAESDYQSEVILFTANDMIDARRITNEAVKLKSIVQVQSLVKLFPIDADARLQKAVNIAKAFYHSGYAQYVVEFNREGLSVESFKLLRNILGNLLPLIDNAQEQALSAGHTNLVERLEKVRSQLLFITKQLASDGEQGRIRSERFLRVLLSEADAGLKVIDTWRQAQPLTPQKLPPSLRDRFFGNNGRIAIYAFPAKSVYDPDNLDALIKDVYSVSPDATGFPTTHQVFSKAVVASAIQGTQLAIVLCLLWVLLATRSLHGFALAAMPMLIGGGWMLGLMSLGHIRYNYANIIALPLVIALAVDYGVWFKYRWDELQGHTPWQVSRVVGKVLGLAAGTELAGLGAITLASYRGVSSLGVSITMGLLCCLTATLLVNPAIGQLLDFKRK